MMWLNWFNQMYLWILKKSTKLKVKHNFQINNSRISQQIQIQFVIKKYLLCKNIKKLNNQLLTINLQSDQIFTSYILSILKQKFHNLNIYFNVIEYNICTQIKYKMINSPISINYPQILQQQGFEQFYDLQQRNFSSFKEIKKSYPEKQKQMPIFIMPKVSQKPKVTRIKDSKQIKQGSMQMKMRRSTQLQAPNSKYRKIIKTQNVIINQNKLSIGKDDRIPIYRIEKQFYMGTNGKNIYKGFNGKNSYQLLKFLSENENRKSNITLRIHELLFNSNFQSGNLNEVYRGHNSNQFNLYLRVDTNTIGHRQWFYFSIKNTRKIRIKLNIYHFKKKYSLYQRGMKPYVKTKHSDWAPGGNNISYKKVEIQQGDQNTQQKYYYLTFEYQFHHENDQVYFAAGIPYTYTYLGKKLTQYSYLAQLNADQITFERSILVKSLSGLQIPLIRIFPKNSHSESIKTHIIINARTHPGQTSSSWVVDGLIEYLISNPTVCELVNNRNIWFTIVPMLNPDGVFVGNYRTGIIGEDFNRNFMSCTQQQFPQIVALKNLIQNYKKDGKVSMFLDLHGHSVFRNSFIFGPKMNLQSNSKLRHLPFMLSKQSPYFSLNSSRFNYNQKKVQTARIYFQNKNILSFTCENSLGLWVEKYISRNVLSETTRQMGLQDWRNFGQNIASSIGNLLGDESDQIIRSLSGIQNQVLKKQQIKQTNNKIKNEPKIQQSKKKDNLSFQRQYFRIKDRKSLNKTSKMSKNDDLPDFFARSKTQKTQNLNQILSNINSSSYQCLDIRKTLSNGRQQNIQILSDKYSSQNQINDSDGESQQLPQRLKKQLFSKVHLLRKRQTRQEKQIKKDYKAQTLSNLNSFKQYIFKFHEKAHSKNQETQSRQRLITQQRYQIFQKTLQGKRSQFYSKRHTMRRKSIKFKQDQIYQTHLQIKAFSVSLTTNNQVKQSRMKELTRIKSIINN